MIQEIDNHKIKSVILMIISLYCKTVLLNRNVKQFEKKTVNINCVYQLNFRQILKGFLLLNLMNIDVVIIYFVM
jgi:hypothetical protein